MNDERSVETAMWIMVLIQAIGSVDMPGKGPRKMPPPRAFVPIVVGFSLIQLIADAGNTKAAKAMAWLTVLSAAVLGPFGTIFTNFLTSVATWAAQSPNRLTAPSPSNASTGGQTP